MARKKSKNVRATTEGVLTGSAIIEGLVALAIAITLICAVARITINRRDAARRCFYWLHATMAVLFSGYLLSMTATAIYTFLLYNSKPTTVSPPASHVQLYFDARLLEPVGRLLRRVGAAVCSAMLAKVASAIGSVIGHESHPLSRGTVYATSGMAGALALAECVFAEVYRAGPGNVKNGKWALPRLDDQFNGSRVGMILGVVAVMVLAVGAVAVGAVVWEMRNAASKYDRLGTVRAFAAVSTCIFFVVRFWAFSEVSLLLAPRKQETKSLAWFYIADAIMDRVGMYLVVLLIYCIGGEQEQGLWSWTRVEG